jgi:hypothetical protein
MTEVIEPPCEETPTYDDYLVCVWCGARPMQGCQWRENRERLAALSRRFDHIKQRRQWELTQKARIMRARQLTNYDEDKDKP